MSDRIETAFEVKIYNRQLREQLRKNREHQLYDESWADLTSRVIRARSAAEARQRAQREYPPEQGFVISSVAAVTLQ